MEEITLMPYKDPEIARIKGLERQLRWQKNNPEAYRKAQDKYWSKQRLNRKCAVDGCPNFCLSHLHCDDHALKKVVGDKLLYNRTRKAMKDNLKLTIKDGRDIFLIMLVLIKAKEVMRGYR